MSSDPILILTEVCRHFAAGSDRVKVLDRLSLTLGQGERIAIMGASGSGKTTLLHLAAGMDQPDQGRVTLHGQDLAALREPALTRLRARQVGLIFQDFNLITSLTVAENIELPLWLNRLGHKPHRSEALIDLLEIGDLLKRFPDSLSGGEKQRVAIARALIHQPGLLLADEPTGSLDQVTADRVMALFDQVIAETGCSLLLVTHNQAAADLCQQTMHLRHGRLSPD